MRTVAQSVRDRLATNSRLYFSGTITFADGSTLAITGTDVMDGSVSFTDSVSSSGSFDIGAAIMNTLSFTLNNWDRKFDKYDFTGSKIVARVGIPTTSTSTTSLVKGTYFIE